MAGCRRAAHTEKLSCQTKQDLRLLALSSNFLLPPPTSSSSSSNSLLALQAVRVNTVHITAHSATVSNYHSHDAVGVDGHASYVGTVQKLPPLPHPTPSPVNELAALSVLCL